MLKLSRLASGDPEIFTSLQGEGVSIGVPSVFVRLSLCNLRCSWCDTRYTWDWQRYDPRTEIVAVDLAEIVSRVIAGTARNVVLTGGEPMLQQRALTPVARDLKAAGRRLEVETNGTYRPTAELAALIDQWNVSPKLENSENDRPQREVPSALGWFASTPHAYFKFVIVEPKDLDEARSLIHRYTVPPERVVLMPEGRDTVAMQERSLWLADACCAAGYRFSPRLHVVLWGDRRGR